MESDSGLLAPRWRSTTRRENFWVMELVVIRPNARALPARTVSRRLVPEVHDEIGAARQLRPRLPAGFGVTVAQFLAHVLAADERRIADDEIGLGPGGRARLQIGPEFGPRVLVRHVLAGDGVELVGDPVPAGDGAARSVAEHVPTVVGDDRVPFDDVVEIPEHRLGGQGTAAGAEVPLQIADPQHQLGDGDGARIDFEPEELVRIDGVRSRSRLAWVSPRSTRASSTSPSSRFISSIET